MGLQFIQAHSVRKVRTQMYTFFPLPPQPFFLFFSIRSSPTLEHQHFFFRRFLHHVISKQNMQQEIKRAKYGTKAMRTSLFYFKLTKLFLNRNPSIHLSSLSPHLINNLCSSCTLSLIHSLTHSLTHSLSPLSLFAVGVHGRDVVAGGARAFPDHLFARTLCR